MAARSPAPPIPRYHQDSSVGIREWLVVLKLLRPRDRRARAAALKMLGLNSSEAEGRRHASSAPPPKITSITATADVSRGPASRHASAPREKLESVRTEEPDQVERAGNPGFERPSAAQPVDLEPQPLFEPSWMRAIVARTMSTMAEVGAYDIERLVELIAQGKAVVDIPRLAAPTLLCGSHLLVDIGEGMEPFAADQQQLVSVVRRVAGRESVDVAWFRGCPSRGAGSDASWAWQPYRAPTSPLALLLVTDLGVGGSRTSPDRATSEEWLHFFRGLPREISVLVLNPYPPKRWPRAIADKVTVLQWDRPLTPSGAWLARTGRP